MFVRIVAFAIGVSALQGCVANRPSDNESATDGSIAATIPVELEAIEADKVTAADIINRSRSHVKRTGEIYMMRGLANVFSRGIDDMAEQLRHGGYDAANFSYKQWLQIAQDIVRRANREEVSYPLIIIGHSLGANESSKFANYLTSNGVDVELVVAFDPVETGFISKGTKTVVNYYLPRSDDIRIGRRTKAEDNTIHASEDFDGILKNIDVSADPTITHVNIDKHPPYQIATFNSIESMTSKRRKPPSRMPRIGDGR